MGTDGGKFGFVILDEPVTHIGATQKALVLWTTGLKFGLLVGKVVAK